MRIARSAVAAVLGSIVAVSGCCKTCSLFHPKEERPPSEERHVAPQTEKTAPLTGSTLPPRTTERLPNNGTPELNGGLPLRGN